MSEEKLAKEEAHQKVATKMVCPNDVWDQQRVMLRCQLTELLDKLLLRLCKEEDKTGYYASVAMDLKCALLEMSLTFANEMVNMLLSRLDPTPGDVDRDQDRPDSVEVPEMVI